MRRLPLRPTILAIVALGAALMASMPATGATSTTVVSVSVPSATTLIPGTCISNQANITLLGSVLPGSTAVSPSPCTVTFGSSNDTGQLRVFRSAAGPTAMGRDTWGYQGNPSSGWVGSVSAVDGSTAFAVDNSGNVLRTTDGGATWTIRSTVAWNISGVFALDASNIWIAGSTGGTGKLARSTDGGASFVDQSPGGATPLRSVHMLSTSLGWAAGFAGMVYKWNGTTWASQPTGVAQDLYKLRAVDANTIYAVGQNRRIIRSVNGGTNWSSVYNGVAGQYFDGLAVANATTAWAFGDGGTILATTDGTTWVPQASGTANRLFGADAVDANTVLAVGDLGTFLRTTDGGTTWTTLPTPTGWTAASIREVDALDGQTAFAGSQFNGIFSIPSTRVTNYGAAPNDFGTATSGFFAICLRSVASATNVWPQTGSCPQSDGTNWRAVPLNSADAAAKAATTATTVQNATASFHFAFRALSTQPPGTYAAPVVFQVLAPDA